MLTATSWSSKASVMILFRNMLKRVGDSRHPCRTPTIVWNQSLMLLLKRTVFDDLDKIGADVLPHGCPQKLQAKPCRRPSWSLRHGRSLAGAGDISHRGFVVEDLLWCTFLLWNLPVLQRWSSPPVASICSVWSSVRHFPERSWTKIAFPCFTAVESFTSWYALLLLFFLRFSSISLHFSPMQSSFAFFYASLGVVVHCLVLVRSFRFKSFLSQFSPFVAQIEYFGSDPVFFSSSDDVCQGSHWLFQSLLC